MTEAATTALLTTADGRPLKEALATAQSRARRKAFLLSLSSGLAEPIGALLAYAVLLPFLSPTLLGCLFGFVAGIMVFISLDELLPAAEEYGEHHISIYGVVTGMALMAVSLIVFS